jgi:hypothetical protein
MSSVHLLCDKAVNINIIMIWPVDWGSQGADAESEQEVDALGGLEGCAESLCSPQEHSLASQRT